MTSPTTHELETLETFLEQAAHAMLRQPEIWTVWSIGEATSDMWAMFYEIRNAAQPGPLAEECWRRDVQKYGIATANELHGTRHTVHTDGKIGDTLYY